MAFWMATDIRRDGNVYFRQEVKGGPYNKIDFNKLADEIRRGAEQIKTFDYYTDQNGKSSLRGEDIKSVVVITWDRLAAPFSVFVNVSIKMIKAENVYMY